MEITVSSGQRKHQQQTGSEREFTTVAALAGPAAAALFAVSVVGFAAVRTDGYTHGTKAVSELGAQGAPLAAAFNTMGFIVPGILVVVMGAVLYRRVTAPRKLGPVLLGLSGVSLAVAGLFPVDMEVRSSVSSQLHLAGAMLCGVLWALSLFWIAPQLKKTAQFSRIGRLTPWFVLFLVANIAWQVVWQSTGALLPGWGQRIGFAGYFLWLGIVGSLLAFSRARLPGPEEVEAGVG